MSSQFAVTVAASVPWFNRMAATLPSARGPAHTSRVPTGKSWNTDRHSPEAWEVICSEREREHAACHASHTMLGLWRTVPLELMSHCWVVVLASQGSVTTSQPRSDGFGMLWG